MLCHMLSMLQRNILSFDNCINRSEQTHSVQAQSDSHEDVNDLFLSFMED